MEGLGRVGHRGSPRRLRAPSRGHSNSGRSRERGFDIRMRRAVGLHRSTDSRLTSRPKGAVMSYPEPRYHDDTGEVSATYRAADHAPEVVYPNGNTVALPRHGRGDARALRPVPLGVRHRGQRPGPALPPDADRVVLRPELARSASTTARAGSTRCQATSSMCPRAESTASGTSRARRRRCSSTSRRARRARATSRVSPNSPARAGRAPEELAEFYRVHDNVWLKE